MDWFKAIMIFMTISFGGVLVYVCATLENLINENGNLKAQIETLKNGRTETTKTITDISDRLDMAIDDFDIRFQSAWNIYDSLNDHATDTDFKILVISDAIENRAKESSEVFEAVRNDINEIREDLLALKANCSELLVGTDVNIEVNLTDLEVEATDQK
nr:MAG TPA: hypothetical protein [Caudoviricetes sp.]